MFAAQPSARPEPPAVSPSISPSGSRRATQGTRRRANRVRDTERRPASAAHFGHDVFRQCRRRIVGLARRADRRCRARFHRANASKSRRASRFGRPARKAVGRWRRRRAKRLGERFAGDWPSRACCATWPTRSWFRRPALCCTCRSMFHARLISIRRCRRGFHSHAQKPTRS